MKKEIQKVYEACVDLLVASAGGSDPKAMLKDLKDEKWAAQFTADERKILKQAAKLMVIIDEAGM